METSFPEEECSGISHSTAMTKWWQAGDVTGRRPIAVGLREKER
jgi:hypothetical protein